jgi:hypothetical protein
MSADHPLARAAARAGFGTDAVLGAQTVAEKVDARILALADLTSTGAASRTEIKGALADLGVAAGSVSGGEHGGYWSWYRNNLARIRAAGERLFSGEPWVADIRGPAWR